MDARNKNSSSYRVNSIQCNERICQSASPTSVLTDCCPGAVKEWYALWSALSCNFCKKYWLDLIYRTRCNGAARQVRRRLGSCAFRSRGRESSPLSAAYSSHKLLPLLICSAISRQMITKKTLRTY